MTGAREAVGRRASAARRGSSVLRRVAAVVALACATAIPVVGCGGDSSSSSSQGGSSGGGNMALNVGVGSASTNYGPYWVAEAKDLFKKNGLDIHVVSYNTSGTTANVVASGQVDVQAFTAPLGLQLAQQGKPISVIYELSRFAASGMSVIGAKGITSFDQLRSAKNCRISTTAVGTVPYAYAARYKEVEGLTNCKIINQNSVGPLIAAVSSGAAQAGVVTYANALSALSAKKVELIVDPLHVPADLAQKLAPTEYPAFVVFGLRDTLEEKSEAVTRFVKALHEANAMMEDMSPEELGKLTAPLKGMQGAPASLLSKAWAGTLDQVPTGPKAGFISPEDWTAALKGFEGWGLPTYDSSSPQLAYDQVVDMSYFDKAG